MTKKEEPRDISSQRLDSEFLEAFPRVPPLEKSYLEIGDDDDSYPLVEGPELPQDATVLGLSDYPTAGAVRLTPSLRLKDFIPDLNQVVLFRLLHRVYGDYELPFIAILADKKGLPLAWSYCVRLSSTLIGAIESRFARVEIVLYKDRASQPNLSDEERARLSAFITKLSVLHTNNVRLFDEGTFIKQKPLVGYVNLFQEKYRAGELLLQMGTDKKVRKTIDDWRLDELLNGQIKAESTGFLLLASALFFFISLEALVNLTYEMLLRDSLRSDGLFNDLTKRDLHVRLNFMHLCCDHFSHPPFQKNVDLMARIREYQVWRNKVIHADLADDLRIYTTVEKGLLLYYFPAVDNRGPNKTRRSEFEVSRFQPMVRSSEVRAMRQIVDDTKNAIFSALDRAAAHSMGTVIDQPVVQNLRVAPTSRPSE